MCMPAANHSMLNMAARYGNAPAVRALLKAGAEASHADATGWHMPLHHVTHCKGCSEEVSLRIAQMLVAAGAEPGLARDKNGVGCGCDKLAPVRAAISSPEAAFSGRLCLSLPQVSASLGESATWAALCRPYMHPDRAHVLFRLRLLRPKRRLGVGGSPS